MKSNHFYTQAHQKAAKILLIAWLLAAIIPAAALAAPKPKPSKQQSTKSTPRQPQTSLAPGRLSPDFFQTLLGSLNQGKQCIDSVKDEHPTIDLQELSAALDDAIEQVNKENPDDKAIAKALEKLGKIYTSLKKYPTVLEYYLQALRIQQALHQGKDHAAVASALTHVVQAYLSLGQYQLALEHAQQALRMQKSLYPGKAHPDVANALKNVMQAYVNLANYPQALKYAQQALRMQKNLYPGKGHPDVADALNNVVRICIHLEKYQLALKYAQQVLRMQKNWHQGADHADIAAELYAVAVIYGCLYDFKQAFEHSTQALTILQRLPPDNFIDRLTTKIVINYCLVFKKLLGQEKPYIGSLRDGTLYVAFRAALSEVDKENTNFEKIAAVMGNLGKAFFCLKKYDESRTYLKYALAIQQALHQGKYHPDVAATLSNVGLAYSCLSEPEQALACSQQALEMYQQLGETQNVDVAKALDAIGLAHVGKDEPEQALARSQQALEMYQQLGETQNVDVLKALLKALNAIGPAYVGKGKLEQALDYYLQALIIIKKLPNPEYVLSKAIAKNYCTALQKFLEERKTDLEQDVFLPRAFDATILEAGKEGPCLQNIARFLKNVGVVYWNLSNYSKALQYFELDLKIQQALPKEAHDNLVEALKDVGETYLRLGKYLKAVQHFNQALEIAQQLASDNGDHPWITMLTTERCEALQQLLKEDKAKATNALEDAGLVKALDADLGEDQPAPTIQQDLYKQANVAGANNRGPVQYCLNASRRFVDYVTQAIGKAIKS